MIESTKQIISVYIDKDLLAQVKQLAADDTRSVNSLIVSLLRNYVKGQGAK